MINDNVLKLKEEIEQLKSSLPKRIDPAFISHISKIPHKVLDLKTALLYRIYDLANDSFELFSKKRFLSGTIVARSLIETVTVLYYLCSKIDKTIKDKDTKYFDEKIMKLILGSRNKITELESINILTIIKSVDKELKVDGKEGALLFCYELMCEYAHPNWKGTAGLYGKPNFEEKYTDFGFDLQNELKREISIHILPIATAMEITTISIKWFNEIINDFIQVCEEAL